MISGGKISNFFSSDELDTIVHVLNKIPGAHNAGNFQAYTNGFTVDNPLVFGLIHKLVISKLKPT